MIVNYKIHEVSEYINWIYFFHAWGFQPKFAAIADIHGCDSCRAMWLTGFAEEDRPKASEAMQLFKEVGGQAVLGRQHSHTTPWLTERHGYDPTC